MASPRLRLIQRRKALGLTQEQLAEHARVDRSTAGRWERGESEPQPWQRPGLARTLQVSVQQLDTLLSSEAECLVAAVSDEPENPSPGVAGDSVDELLMRSVRESETILAARPDAVDFGILQEAVAQLGASYVTSPPYSMLKQGLALRVELLRRMNVGAFRPSELLDFYMSVGQVSGVIAYAALDLGDADAAAIHGAAVWRMADLADDNRLRAWARGTQSLIARFNREFFRAQLFAENGFRHAGVGASRPRLLCAAAQCAANQGDEARALELIEEARRARDAGEPDSVEGIFGFPLAKQKYYAASSLMWLSDRKSLIMAIENATDAIAAWRGHFPKKQVIDDEALACVYLATARLKLGELDGAMEAVRPVMEVPRERKTSWMRRRIANLREILSGDRFNGSASAASARQKLYEFEAG